MGYDDIIIAGGWGERVPKNGRFVPFCNWEARARQVRRDVGRNEMGLAHLSRPYGVGWLEVDF
ncbi:MAG: hypothetical protein AAF614_16480 [Chloroflexota bacterium]